MIPRRLEKANCNIKDKIVSIKFMGLVLKTKRLAQSIQRVFIMPKWYDVIVIEFSANPARMPEINPQINLSFKVIKPSQHLRYRYKLSFVIYNKLSPFC